MALDEKKHIYNIQVEITDGKVSDICSVYWGCCIYKNDKAIYQWTEIEKKRSTDELKKAIYQIIEPR